MAIGAIAARSVAGGATRSAATRSATSGLSRSQLKSEGFPKELLDKIGDGKSYSHVTGNGDGSFRFHRNAEKLTKDGSTFEDIKLNGGEKNSLGSQIGLTKTSENGTVKEEVYGSTSKLTNVMMGGSMFDKHSTKQKVVRHTDGTVTQSNKQTDADMFGTMTHKDKTTMLTDGNVVSSQSVHGSILGQSYAYQRSTGYDPYGNVFAGGENMGYGANARDEAEVIEPAVLVAANGGIKA